MTDRDEHCEIGRMYVEREDVERRLACVANRLRRYRYACERVVEVIDGNAEWTRSSSDGEPVLIVPGDQGAMAKECEARIAPVRELLEALEFRQSLLVRLGELNVFFESRTKS